MTKKELVELIIENFSDEENGDVDLRDLDFSSIKGCVMLDGMKAKEIFQGFHKANAVYQEFHEAGQVYQAQSKENVIIGERENGNSK